MKNRIKCGSCIETNDGKLIVRGRGNAMYTAFVEEYVYDDDTGDVVYARDLTLTFYEIAKRMKEMDGRNHQVVFDD